MAPSGYRVGSSLGVQILVPGRRFPDFGTPRLSLPQLFLSQAHSEQRSLEPPQHYEADGCKTLQGGAERETREGSQGRRWQHLEVAVSGPFRGCRDDAAIHPQPHPRVCCRRTLVAEDRAYSLGAGHTKATVQARISPQGAKARGVYVRVLQSPWRWPHWPLQAVASSPSSPVRAASCRRAADKCGWFLLLTASAARVSELRRYHRSCQTPTLAQSRSCHSLPGD